MGTTAKTLPNKFWIVALAAAVLCSAAAFYFASNSAERVATEFLAATASEDWGRVYEFMGPPERAQIKMDSKQFTQFCRVIAAAGWPRADRPEIEEMTPFVPQGTKIDTTWSVKGTHRFSVTFRRPDGSSDLHTTIEYRHDPSGEWHPDVLPFVLAISRGTPQGHPVEGLINAMKAIKIDRLETYPLHQRTTIAKLERLLAKKRGTYLETPIQFFH